MIGFNSLAFGNVVLICSPFQIRQRQALQHQNLRPAQHSGVQLERWILGRGPDQQDRSILHMRQEAVLLRLVKAVDLVDEQQCPLPVLSPDFRRIKDLAELRHTAENRADLHEMQVRLICQQSRDRRFANAGRPPENQRPQRPRLQHDRQRRVRPQHL